MGLPNEYDKITQQPLPGWHNNIMGQLPGIVQQKNIDMIVNMHFSPEQLSQCSCNR